jgi:hypothetical protein
MELQNLRLLELQRSEQLVELERQTREAQQSLTHAEKTIAVLNEELERRYQEVKTLRCENEKAVPLKQRSVDDVTASNHV